MDDKFDVLKSRGESTISSCVQVGDGFDAVGVDFLKKDPPFFGGREVFTWFDEENVSGLENVCLGGGSEGSSVTLRGSFLKYLLDVVDFVFFVLPFSKCSFLSSTEVLLASLDLLDVTS